MKIIHINAYHFKFFDKLVEFLKNENPNIINIQEIAEGSLNYAKNPSEMNFNQLKKS